MCEKLNFLKIQEEQGICPFKSVLFKNKQTKKKCVLQSYQDIVIPSALGQPGGLQDSQNQ